MDPIFALLKSYGYTNQQIHGTKAQKKLQMIADYFGIGRIPAYTKKQAKAILRHILENETITPDSVADVAIEGALIYNPDKFPPPDLTPHQLTICNLPAKKFYSSREWQDVRYRALERFGNICHCCGRSPSDGVVIHVDHILPRSIYPEHALNLRNLQILCEDCNTGKSNVYERCWRK